jgi:hypothetical protein
MNLLIALKSAQAGQVNAERLINMYAEKTGGGRSPVQILSSHGLALFGTTGTGAGRGIFTFQDQLYTVVGEVLYRITTSGAAVVIGAISGTGQVVAAASTTELCIAAGGNAYIYDGTLTQITDPDFLGADAVEFLDGYFIFSNGTGQFSISALYAGGTIDALDFASAESDPDIIVRAFVDHREVLLFGTRTIETWVNTGGVDFPLERVSGGITEKGLAGFNAIAKIDNSVIWLDQDGIVRRLAGGYSPVRISTHEVEKTLTDIDQAECFAYTYGGHEFFVLSTPSITWLFDAATQMWHERKSLGEDRWRVRGHAFCYNKHYFGDFENGNIYELDDTVFTEAGDELVSEIIFPVIHNEGDRFRLHRLLVDMSVGETTDHSEPQIRLDLSEDGVEWNTVGYGTLGATGERKHRLVWRRLGQHRYLHVRFLISDPCKRAMYASYGEVEVDK